MKTFLPTLLLFAVCFTAKAQESRTTFDGATVVSTPSGLAVQLTWKKGAENIAYFLVERSTNGVDFTQCALVFTSEDPDFVDYKFREKIGSSSHGQVYRIGLVSDQKRVTYLPAKKIISPEVTLVQPL